MCIMYMYHKVQEMYVDVKFGQILHSGVEEKLSPFKNSNGASDS